MQFIDELKTHPNLYELMEQSIAHKQIDDAARHQGMSEVAIQ